jgi:hypothetical protein
MVLPAMRSIVRRRAPDSASAAEKTRSSPMGGNAERLLGLAAKAKSGGDAGGPPRNFFQDRAFHTLNHSREMRHG